MLLVTSPPRLAATNSPASSLFSVPWHTTLLWSLLDSLSFYTSGHQPTFPHIQWSAAFVGFVGGWTIYYFPLRTTGPIWGPRPEFWSNLHQTWHTKHIYI